jgi:hypothetical protein
VLVDQGRERPGVGERVPGQKLRDDRERAEDVARRRGGVELAQRPVVRRADEGERRHQRPGGHAGDDLEDRPLPGRGPAVEQSRTERAVRAASRDREMSVLDDAVGALREIVGRLLVERRREIALHRRVACPGPRPDVGKVRDRRLVDDDRAGPLRGSNPHPVSAAVRPRTASCPQHGDECGRGGRPVTGAAPVGVSPRRAGAPCGTRARSPRRSRRRAAGPFAWMQASALAHVRAVASAAHRPPSRLVRPAADCSGCRRRAAGC